MIKRGKNGMATGQRNKITVSPPSCFFFFYSVCRYDICTYKNKPCGTLGKFAHAEADFFCATLFCCEAHLCVGPLCVSSDEPHFVEEKKKKKRGVQTAPPGRQIEDVFPGVVTATLSFSLNVHSSGFINETPPAFSSRPLFV